MIVGHDDRGYGFHVNAVPAADGRSNAEVQVRPHFLLDAKAAIRRKFPSVPME